MEVDHFFGWLTLEWYSINGNSSKFQEVKNVNKSYCKT